MRYEKAVETGRKHVAEELILETLSNGDLSGEDLLTILQNDDPLLLIFNLPSKKLKQMAPPANKTFPRTFTREVIMAATAKLEKEGKINLADGKYRFTQS
jgi:hypothetical protein